MATVRRACSRALAVRRALAARAISTMSLTPGPYAATRSYAALTAPMPSRTTNIFASLSSCRNHDDVQRLLDRAPVDAKVASHALHCLANMRYSLTSSGQTPAWIGKCFDALDRPSRPH